MAKSQVTNHVITVSTERNCLFQIYLIVVQTLQSLQDQSGEQILGYCPSLISLLKLYFVINKMWPNYNWLLKRCVKQHYVGIGNFMWPGNPNRFWLQYHCQKYWECSDRSGTDCYWRIYVVQRLIGGLCRTRSEELMDKHRGQFLYALLKCHRHTHHRTDWFSLAANSLLTFLLQISIQIFLLQWYLLKTCISKCTCI